MGDGCRTTRGLFPSVCPDSGFSSLPHLSSPSSAVRFLFLFIALVVRSRFTLSHGAHIHHKVSLGWSTWSVQGGVPAESVTPDGGVVCVMCRSLPVRRDKLQGAAPPLGQR